MTKIRPSWIDFFNQTAGAYIYCNVCCTTLRTIPEVRHCYDMGHFDIERKAHKNPILLSTRIDDQVVSSTSTAPCPPHRWRNPIIGGAKNFFGDGEHRAELIETCSVCRAIKTEIWLTYNWYEAKQ